MTTQIHDSATCRAGVNGARCEMCQFAEKAAQRAEHEEIDLPRAKNVPDRPQTQNTAISVNGHLLYTEQNCSVFHDSDKQCPVHEGGLAVCRLCNEYEAGLDEPCRKAQPTEPITIPTFEQEWQDAPKRATRTTERESAEYWFIRGQHAREVELLVGQNSDLKEIARVVRERLGR